MNININFKRIKQAIPKDAIAAAKDFGLLKRKRVIKNTDDLLRLILLYCGADMSLRSIAGLQAMQKKPIKDVSILAQLEKSEEWVKHLLSKFIHHCPKGEGLLKNHRLIIVDGSHVSGPGSKGKTHLVHMAYDSLNYRFHEVKITTNKVGESLKLFTIKEKEIWLTDRAYGKAPQIAHVANQNAHIITRITPRNVQIWNASSTALIKLEHVLKSQSKDTVSLPVTIKSTDKKYSTKGWVYAYRLPEKHIKAASKRCRKMTLKRRKSIQESTVYLSQWLIIFSTLSPQQINVDKIPNLYRWRWQIELLFKRLKSILNLDKLRSNFTGKLSMLWLTGKLLYAAILMKFASEIKDLSKQKNISDWRLFSILKILLNCAMLPTLTTSVLSSDLTSFFQKKINPFSAASILDGS